MFIVLATRLAMVADLIISVNEPLDLLRVEKRNVGCSGSLFRPEHCYPEVEVVVDGEARPLQDI